MSWPWEAGRKKTRPKRSREYPMSRLILWMGRGSLHQDEFVGQLQTFINLHNLIWFVQHIAAMILLSRIYRHLLRRLGKKDWRGIPDGWMIGYYKIHICETIHLVCWARCVLYVPNNPDDCSHKSEFQITLLHPTVKTTLSWNVAFLAKNHKTF